MRGSHSSYGQEIKELSCRSKISANWIKNSIKEKIPVLIYTGMSGISSATAIALQYYSYYKIECEMVYVRKNHEESHGYQLERSFGDILCFSSAKITPTTHELIFVDDFVSTGTTMKHCLYKIQEELNYMQNPFEEFWICLTGYSETKQQLVKENIKEILNRTKDFNYAD